MKTQLFRSLLPLLLSLACASALPAQFLGEPAAPAYPAIRTSREQQQVVAGIVAPAELPNFTPSHSADGLGSRALQQVERAIRLANVNHPESLCQPVSWADLSRLQIDLLRSHGLDLSDRQIQALTDTAQALLRESPGQSLALKFHSTSANRPGLHGLVAELAEARERQIQLTRNKQSSMIDLTEPKVRPRNFQVKVYSDNKGGMRAVINELKPAPWRATGLVPQSALDQGVQSGKLCLVGEYYVTTDGSGVRLEPLQSFNTPEESRHYTKEGLAGLQTLTRTRPGNSTTSKGLLSAEPGGVSPEGSLASLKMTQMASKFVSHSFHAYMGLLKLRESAPAVIDDLRLLVGGEPLSMEIVLRLGQNSSQVFHGSAMVMPGAIALVKQFSQTLAQSSRLASISRWAGPIGWVAVASYEAVTFARWQNGLVTNRDYYTGRANVVGILGGGIAGGWVGAKTGAFVGAFFGPEGIPIGATIRGVTGFVGGSFFGSNLAVSGANASFEFHDKKQDAEYIQFLKTHYDVK